MVRSLRSFSRVPLHADVRAPVLEGGECELCHEVRALAARRHLPGQRHARGLEVVGLPEGAGYELPAALRIEQAAGHPDAHLVGVADAVRAHVAVGAEQLHRVEVRERGVEHRQLALVAVRHVHVQQARLERQLALIVRAARPLEHQAGVEARDRQGARGRALQLPGSQVVELVLGGAPRERRPQEVARTGEVERQPRHDVGAPAAGDAHRLLRMQEVHQFRVEAVVQHPVGPEAVVGVQDDARHARVRPVGVAGRQVEHVDGLVLLRLGVEHPVLTAVGERGTPLDEGRAGALGSLREVLEVAGVADVLGVYVEAEVGRQLGQVGEAHAAAAVAEGAVVGQVVPVELAALALR